MTHQQVFETFESLDIDDNVKVKLADGRQQVWSLYDVHLENEGLYVQYFPLGQGKVELAFIPVEPPSTIVAVKNY